MNNSIFTIFPYSIGGGGWAFDDESVGLVREPFVAGADDLLTLLSGGKEKLEVTFSNNWFPYYQLVLEKLTLEELELLGIKEVPSGTFYKEPLRMHVLWLCPALNLYYPESPEKIYIKIK